MTYMSAQQNWRQNCKSCTYQPQDQYDKRVLDSIETHHHDRKGSASLEKQQCFRGVEDKILML